MRTLEAPVDQAWAARELEQWITSMGTIKKRCENRHIQKVIELLDSDISDHRIATEGDAVWCDAFRGGLEQRCKQLDARTNKIRPFKPYINAERTRYPPPHVGRAFNHLTNELARWHNRLCAATARRGRSDPSRCLYTLVVSVCVDLVVRDLLNPSI